MEPALPVWPLDPVTIRIQLHAPADFPGTVTMVPRVTLGTKPIDVAWQRDGSELRATVEPQSGAGPWALRVDVHDQHGIPLGHDFVEVVARRR